MKIFKPLRKVFVCNRNAKDFEIRGYFGIKDFEIWGYFNIKDFEIWGFLCNFAPGLTS